MFITVFTTVRHLSLSWARRTQYVPPSNLILSFHLRVSSVSPKWCFFSIRSPNHLSSSHTCYMPGPSHPSWFRLPNNIGWAVQIVKLLVTWAFPLHYSRVPVRPKYLLQHHILGDQVAHPYTTKGKIVVLYILIRIILNSWKTEDSRSNGRRLVNLPLV